MILRPVLFRMLAPLGWMPLVRPAIIALAMSTALHAQAPRHVIASNEDVIWGACWTAMHPNGFAAREQATAYVTAWEPMSRRQSIGVAGDGTISNAVIAKYGLTEKHIAANPYCLTYDHIGDASRRAIIAAGHPDPYPTYDPGPRTFEEAVARFQRLNGKPSVVRTGIRLFNQTAAPIPSAAVSVARAGSTAPAAGTASTSATQQQQLDAERKQAGQDLANLTGAVMAQNLREGRRVGAIYTSSSVEAPRCPLSATSCQRDIEYSSLGVLIGTGTTSYLNLSLSMGTLSDLYAEEGSTSETPAEEMAYTISYLWGWNLLGVDNSTDAAGLWPIVEVGYIMGGPKSEFLYGLGLGFRFGPADFLMTAAPFTSTMNSAFGLTIRF